MPDGCVSIMLEASKPFAGRKVLEIGTSRGRLTAMLASIGCNVTTVDRHDRGAAQNLEGLNVRIIVEEAVNYLRSTSETYEAIVVDLHGNSTAIWRRLGPLILRRLARGGTAILGNATLPEIPEWREETGVPWFLDQLRPPWKFKVHTEHLPGVAIVTHD
jgi:predicted O-methyltransferase YrrM